jgi:hypothetical protein
VALLYAGEGADVAIVYLRDEPSDAKETRSTLGPKAARVVIRDF